MGRQVCNALFVVALATAAGPVRADVTVGVGLDYTVGRYQYTEDTRILYVPVTLERQSERYWLRLTIPYLRIDAPAGGATVAARPGGAMVRAESGVRETGSGLGDVVMAAGYSVFESAASGTLVDLVGKIKLGTADADDGLGTGETDYSLQLDGYRTIHRLTLLAGIGYRVYGDPPGTDFDNTFFGAVGGVFKFTPDLSAGLIYDLRDNVVLDTEPQYELTAFVTSQVTARSKLQVYVLTGFSDSSPDWGVGLMFVRGL